ncbi:MAG: methyltransferase [Candidatus Aminicenantes bacterium]|nr:methyltransferase [Candidatus Aminicenantes bacterium]
MSKNEKPKVPPLPIINMVIRFTNFLVKLRRKILPPQVLLVESLIENFVIERCIYITTEAWIPDMLAGGPKNIEQLAKNTGLNEDALYRVMRALTGVGIFKEKKGKVFGNTNLSKSLQSNIVGSMAALAKYTGAAWNIREWADIYQSIEKGKDIFQIKYGKKLFDWLEENPEEFRIFDEAMTPISRLSDNPITAAYNFSGIGSIVDIGAGHGFQLAAILKANPKMKGGLFELERVMLAAKQEEALNDPLVKDRVKFAAGDFFKSAPKGYDAYFMKSILHDWSDNDAIKILKNCRRAIHDKGKLLVVDMVVKSDNKPHLSKYFDIAMILLVNGRERTREGFEKIFKESGFKLNRIIPTISPYYIVEGVPI